MNFLKKHYAGMSQIGAFLDTRHFQSFKDFLLLKQGMDFSYKHGKDAFYRLKKY